VRVPWLRLLIVPLVVLPLAWLLFTGLGRDPRLIPSPLIGKPMARLRRNDAGRRPVLVRRSGRKAGDRQLLGELLHPIVRG